MSMKSVFCITTTRAQADQIVDRLKNAGFSNNDISVLFPDKDTTRDFAHEKNTKAPEGIATGAGTGGVVGGALGWLAGIGALAIPGAGPFIAAGPILAALSGAAVGSAVDLSWDTPPGATGFEVLRSTNGRLSISVLEIVRPSVALPRLTSGTSSVTVTVCSVVPTSSARESSASCITESTMPLR